MECRKVLTEDNTPYILFMLDTYGVLELGKFVLIAYSNGRKTVALTKGGVSRIMSVFDHFDRVEIKFECDKKLAGALGAQVLHAHP